MPVGGVDGDPTTFLMLIICNKIIKLLVSVQHVVDVR